MKNFVLLERKTKDSAEKPKMRVRPTIYNHYYEHPVAHDDDDDDDDDDDEDDSR